MQTPEMIVQQLDALAELESQISAALAGKQEAIDKVLTPELRGELAAIDAEFNDRVSVARGQAEAMKASINETVREHGATVKGAHLMAVFSERNNWDSKKLAGFAVAHPEIMTFVTKSRTVAIRAIGK